MTIRTDQEENQLQIAVRLGDLSMVRSALNEGCDPNEVGLHGWTVLHEAVSNGSSSITLALLRKGGNPDLQDSINRSSALHIAAINGNAKLVQVLLDSGASITLKNVGGKTPEQLASSSTCKELLEKKRIALLMRGGDTSGKAFQRQSVQKMYVPKQEGKDLNGSINNMESLDYNENIQPGPGEIKVSFEFLKRYSELKVNVLEIRDLKLPPVHNYTTLYVKCYLLPDKYKDTKRKTSELRIEMSEGTSSRSGSASSQSSQSSAGSTYSLSSTGSGKQISDKVRSVLKKRPHLHSKKNRDEVECMLHNVARDTVCRASTTIDETLSYGSSALRKTNVGECQVHLSVCGRNRYSAKGIPIADVMIPLAVGLKKQEAEWFLLEYKIDMPATLCRERKASPLNQSFEMKDGGHYTGRSLAWDQGLSSESSTDITSPGTQQQGGTVFKPPVQPAIKKHHKHASKTARFLKGELKLFRGKNQQHNARYNRSKEESLGSSLGESSSDAVEYIGQGYRGSHNNLSVSSKTVMDRQINEQFSSVRNWHSVKTLNESHQSIGYDFSTEDEVQVLNSKYDVFQGSGEQSSSRPSMMYSRAFVESARKQRFHEDDVAVEDVEEDFDVYEQPHINPHRPKAYRH